jgi:hypothetical protein
MSLQIAGGLPARCNQEIEDVANSNGGYRRMVRVTIRRDYIRTEFEFKDFDVASEFANLALNAATKEITVEFEKVAEPEEGRPEEPEEVPAEELESVEEYF